MDSNRLRLAFGAQECQPFSYMGQQRGWLDDRTQSAIAFIDSVTDPVNKVDSFMVECTTAWQPELTHMLVGEEFDMQHTVISPIDFGHPYQRRRRIGIWNRKASCCYQHVSFEREIVEGRSQNEGFPQALVQRSLRRPQLQMI